VWNASDHIPYFGFTPQLQRMVALSEKASHGPAGKSMRGPAS
jgi:hypothetical protein